MCASSVAADGRARGVGARLTRLRAQDSGKTQGHPAVALECGHGREAPKAPLVPIRAETGLCGDHPMSWAQKLELAIRFTMVLFFVGLSAWAAIRPSETPTNSRRRQRLTALLLLAVFGGLGAWMFADLAMGRHRFRHDPKSYGFSDIWR